MRPTDYRQNQLPQIALISDSMSLFMPPLPPPYVGELSDDAIGRLSVAYIGPKSRTEKPRETKIGTSDSDTIFKVKRSRSQRGGGILWRPPAQLVKSRLKNFSVQSDFY